MTEHLTRLDAPPPLVGLFRLLGGGTVVSAIALWGVSDRGTATEFLVRIGIPAALLAACLLLASLFRRVDGAAGPGENAGSPPESR